MATTRRQKKRRGQEGREKNDWVLATSFLNFTFFYLVFWISLRTHTISFFLCRGAALRSAARLAFCWATKDEKTR